MGRRIVKNVELVNNRVEHKLGWPWRSILHGVKRSRSVAKTPKFWKNGEKKKILEKMRERIEGVGARDTWLGNIAGETCVVSVEPSFPCFDCFCIPLTFFVIYSIGNNNVALTRTKHCCKHMHQNSSVRIPYVHTYVLKKTTDFAENGTAKFCLSM